jgi:hypothetical protein
MLLKFFYTWNASKTLAYLYQARQAKTLKKY